MAILRDRPYGNANFLVDLGSDDARAVTAGFCEVVFPAFTLDAKKIGRTTRTKKPLADAAPAESGKNLLLKRGVIGSLDLYGWWNNARLGKAPKRRSARIELLSEDHTTVVLTWRFSNVSPVSLAYSPLRANEGSVLIETLELAFDRVEMT